MQVRGEAPTTVEIPFEDVTMGVRNAISEVEELSGRKLMDSRELLLPPRVVAAQTCSWQPAVPAAVCR